MRAEVTHNVDKNEDLLANLETTKSEATASQKLVEKDVHLRQELQDLQAKFDFSLAGWSLVSRT